MIQYFKRIGSITLGLLKGLGVTWKYLFQRSVTIQYPKEKAPIPERFRGMLIFHIDECIACDLCVHACPSACIALESLRNEAGRKVIQNYTIDFGKCNWCRLCEEACPTNPKSVHHTLEYELVFLSRDDFKITWTKDAQGRPLAPVNAAGQVIGPWADTPDKHLSVGIGAHKAPPTSPAVQTH
jgi:NADH-quinone oxidoreductase subunit I